MHPENMAERLIRIDDMIGALSSHDPSFVERRLAPRRARAWGTFRAKFSADCSSARAWEIVGLLTRSAAQ